MVGDPAVGGGAQGAFPLIVMLPIIMAVREGTHEALLRDPADEVVDFQAQAGADQPPEPGVQGYPAGRHVRPVFR